MPNAVGGVVNDTTVPALQCRAIVGAPTIVERIEAPGATLLGVRPGDRVTLDIDGRRLHFFDPATEAAVG